MARAVGYSEDFERITRLPARHINEETAARANAFMTPLLTTPLGKKAGASLIGWQGTALEELCDLGGGYNQMNVGEGKTLVTFLAPTVVEAERPILIVPAKLREKTWIEFQQYSEHWVTPENPAKIMAYHDFYDRDDVDLFERLQPDFVMLDEVHHATKQDGSFAKRLDRWVVKSNCKVWCGTGTGTRFSIKDFSHMLIWALNDGAPVPLDTDELEMWAAAIDEKRAWSMGVKPRRVQVGVLVELDARLGKKRPEFYITEQGEARVALRNRLHATPGVIISLNDSCKMPLSVDLIPAPEDETLNAHFAQFRLRNMTPDGEVIADPPVMYTKEKQLGAGFFMKWDPPPDDEWREANRGVNRFVLDKIQRSAHLGYKTVRTCSKCGEENARNATACAHCAKKLAVLHGPLDTPGAVFDVYGDHPIVVEWERVRRWFDPAKSSKAEWVSASVVHTAVKYAREVKGLIWAEFTELGEAIAKAAGIPYYGEDGCDASGRSIEREAGGRSVVLSVGANAEGRNLQGGPYNANKEGWNDALTIGVPQSSRLLEQKLGRMHRRGQLRPVRERFLLTSGLSLQSWQTAQREAGFVQQSQGYPQKIVRAKTTIAAFPSHSGRWRVKDDGKEDAELLVLASVFKKTGVR